MRRHREKGLDLGGCRAFLLDEYVGTPTDHPQSYHRTIRRMVTDRVGLAVACPDGTAADLPAEAASYEERIREAGGIDVQLLGLGTDGHVGFNEPGSSLRPLPRLRHRPESRVALRSTVGTRL